MAFGLTYLVEGIRQILDGICRLFKVLIHIVIRISQSLVQAVKQILLSCDTLIQSLYGRIRENAPLTRA